MIEKLIHTRKAHIGIIGMGYVGLPLAYEFSKKCHVTGFEVNPAKVKSLNKGISYIPDVPSEKLKPLVRSGQLSATTQFQKLAQMNVVIVCVPTPLRKTKDPDMSYINAAIKSLRPYLRKNQLIVLESTTYPGTTREVVLPKLEKPGFKVGKDFYLVFSPERVDPGNKKFGIHNTPKIVGGITRACTRLGKRLYEAVADQVIEVSSPEAAEMAKLLENTFRAVNIALVNEVTLMCDRLKLDVWEVIEAAASKPFGFMPFYPGPGIGGHCIPLDPQYLSWKLKSLNYYSRFIELAEEINSSMPDYVVRKVSEGLNAHRKAVKGARVLVLGVAYKKDISDVRESPALGIIAQLEQQGARVQYYDPYVKTVRLHNKTYTNILLTPSHVRRQDCVVIATNHTCFDMKTIVKNAVLVVDARNATKGIADKKIIKL